VLPHLVLLEPFNEKVALVLLVPLLLLGAEDLDDLLLVELLPDLVLDQSLLVYPCPLLCELLLKGDDLLLTSVLDGVDAHLEGLDLMVAQHSHEWLRTVPVYLSRLCDVVLHLRKMTLVQIDKGVEGAFADVEGAQTWQEVIADEKAEEHKVVYNTLEVEAHLHLRLHFPVLQLEVLSQEVDKDKLEVKGLLDV
jgi:hypothetical protein